MCIDIMKILFGTADGQISSILDSYLPATRSYFRFWTITWVNINRVSPNGMCIYIMEVWFGIANGQTELSAHQTIVAGYFRSTFLL